MAKDTRIAFRASAELKARLAKASKKIKLGETALAEAAVEAAVEYVEQHGGIWFPLRVVPDPEAKVIPEKTLQNPTTEKPRQEIAQTAPPGIPLTGSMRSSTKVNLNETPDVDVSEKKAGTPRVTRTRAVLRNLPPKRKS